IVAGHRHAWMLGRVRGIPIVSSDQHGVGLARIRYCRPAGTVGAPVRAIAEPVAAAVAPPRGVPVVELVTPTRDARFPVSAAYPSPPGSAAVPPGPDIIIVARHGPQPDQLAPDSSRKTTEMPSRGGCEPPSGETSDEDDADTQWIDRSDAKPRHAVWPPA